MRMGGRYGRSGKGRDAALGDRRCLEDVVAFGEESAWLTDTIRRELRSLVVARLGFYAMRSDRRKTESWICFGSNRLRRKRCVALRYAKNDRKQ